MCHEPEALCMSGDNVKNKASQNFLQPGQMFGTQDRQSQLRLDSGRLPRKPWPQGHCQAAGLVRQSLPSCVGNSQ